MYVNEKWKNNEQRKLRNQIIHKCDALANENEIILIA